MHTAQDTDPDFPLLRDAQAGVRHDKTNQTDWRRLGHMFMHAAQAGIRHDKTNQTDWRRLGHMFMHAAQAGIRHDKTNQTDWRGLGYMFMHGAQDGCLFKRRLFRTVKLAMLKCSTFTRCSRQLISLSVRMQAICHLGVGAFLHGICLVVRKVFLFPHRFSWLICPPRLTGR